MPNKNLVILVGHLGGDPEVKYAASGTCVCNFSLATSWGKKDSAGNWENFTDWHKVVCFGGVAERANDVLFKGMAAMIEGSIRYESWEDNEGVKKYMTKIIANRVDSLAPKEKTGSADKDAEKYHDPVKEKPKDAADNAKENREAATRAAQEKSTEKEDDGLPF